jgi:hypothetical protein
MDAMKERIQIRMRRREYLPSLMSGELRALK